MIDELYERLRSGPEPLVVLTGGQTGVDQLALWEAVRLGVAAVAVMPRGRRVDGVVPAPELAPGVPPSATVYELESDDYRERTWANAWLADLTLLWDLGGEGVEETRRACVEYGRALVEMPGGELPSSAPRVVQIAGSRARFIEPGRAGELRNEIADALRRLAARSGS